MKCKYCGKEFDKSNLPNRTMYCSDYCRLNARRERNAKAQRKRRLLAKQGLIILSDKEKNELGTGNLREHRNKNLNKELKMVETEARRFKLIERRPKGFIQSIKV